MQRPLDRPMTAQERYDMLDEAMTNVLRAAGAAGATATDALMDQVVIYERCVRVALGMPIETTS